MMICSCVGPGTAWECLLFKVSSRFERLGMVLCRSSGIFPLHGNPWSWCGGHTVKWAWLLQERCSILEIH